VSDRKTHDFRVYLRTKVTRYAHIFIYKYVSPNDVSVNDGPHVRRWSHNIIRYYNILLEYLTIVFTIDYSIQYSNMLYRFVA